MKRTHVNMIILVLICITFALQYYLMVSNIEEMFRHTIAEVKNEIMNEEIKLFKSYLIEKTLFLFLQSIGMFLCLNIGFLYFKIKTGFKNILNLITFSFLSVVIYQFLIIVIVKLSNWIFTVDSMNAVSKKLNIGNYINVEKTVPWVKLPLTSINLEQLLILMLLGLSIHRIIKIKYTRAFTLALKTYGLGFLLWFVFAMVMEMNFG